MRNGQSLILCATRVCHLRHCCGFGMRDGRNALKKLATKKPGFFGALCVGSRLIKAWLLRQGAASREEAGLQGQESGSITR